MVGRKEKNEKAFHAFHDPEIIIATPKVVTAGGAVHEPLSIPVRRAPEPVGTGIGSYLLRIGSGIMPIDLTHGIPNYLTKLNLNVCS